MVLPDGTPEPLYARAMAIVNAQGKPLLLADIENQGTFAAYKQCACGIWAIAGSTAAMVLITSASTTGAQSMIGMNPTFSLGRSRSAMPYATPQTKSVPLAGQRPVAQDAVVQSTDHLWSAFNSEEARHWAHPDRGSSKHAKRAAAR